MCNCGNKRQALLSASKSTPRHPEYKGGAGKPIPSTVPNNAVKIRYTGNHSLHIRSTVSRHTYSFTADHRELLIRPEDVPMMGGYSELVQD